MKILVLPEMLWTCAVSLSLVESVSQYLLKRFALGGHILTLVGGVSGYVSVALVLLSFYMAGVNLASAQVAWSITSSALALVSGAVMFGEPIGKLIAPAALLGMAIVLLQ